MLHKKRQLNMTEVQETQVADHRVAGLLRVSEMRAARALMLSLCLVLALIPILNITWIVGSTGANNVSNDYVGYVKFIDQILNGTYNWRSFFSDTFIGGAHCMALPMLVRLAVVKFASWNIYLELYISIALALLKLILLYQSFTLLIPRQPAHSSR